MARRKKTEDEQVETPTVESTEEGGTAENPVPYRAPLTFGSSASPVDSSKQVYQVMVPKFFINGQNVRKGTFVETDEETAARAGNRLRLVE